MADVLEGMMRALGDLGRRTERLECIETGGEWADWTPTLTQGGTVSLTIQEAKYSIVGRVCHVYARLTATAGGTVSNVINVGGLPYSLAYTGDVFAVGSAFILDAGTVLYHAAAAPASATTLKFGVSGLTDYLGTTGGYTLANNDIVSFTATYRIA